MAGKKGKKPDKSKDKKGRTNPALVEDDESDPASESEESGAVGGAHSAMPEFESADKPSGHQRKLGTAMLKYIKGVCDVGKAVIRHSIGSSKDKCLLPGPEPSPKPQTKETVATSQKDVKSVVAERCKMTEFKPDKEPSLSVATQDTDVDSLKSTSSLPKDNDSVAEASETKTDDGAGPGGTESGSMKRKRRPSDDHEDKSPKPEDKASN